MRKRTSDYYSSDTEQMVASEDIGAKALSIEYQDIYLMRPPTKLIFDSSFKEAKHFYDTGDEEVQQLLLKECTLIYECKLCRNMFRSLTQFIGHKREFCRSATHYDGDISEGDKYNGFSSNEMVTKEICNNINSRSKSLLQTTDEAVQQTRTPESKELMDEKISANCLNQAVAQNENEKIKNILACPQEHCMLNFSNTKELELHFSQDHAKSMVFTSFVDPIMDSQKQGLSEAVLTRAQRIASNNCHTCEHCAKTFERSEALSTHLLHCPVKHNILSKTLATGTGDNFAVKRLKLESSTPAVTCNDKETHKLDQEIVNKADGVVTDSQNAVTVKQEYVHSESSNSGNTNVATKKRKLKNRRIITTQIIEDNNGPTRVDGISNTKQEHCNEVSRTHAKIKSECHGNEGSDSEPKKLVSTCTYCGKSFERRAALSTHLQHCAVKQSVIEKNTIYGMNTCSKRSKLHSTSEKTHTKESRQQNIVDDPDTDLLNEMFANLGRQTFGVGLQTVTIDHDDTTASGTDDAKEVEDEEKLVQMNTPTKLDENLPSDQSVTGVELSASITTTSESSPGAHREEDTDKKGCRRVRSAPMEKRLLCRCKICYKQFNALSNLRRHISMFHYRAQRFGCTLCDYRAFRRYDIVNHLGNTHGMKGDPEAMSVEFVTEHEVNYSREDVEGDIVVLDEGSAVVSAINESTEDVENSIETNQNLKRLKRNKTISISNGLSVTLNKVTRPKIKRSQSQHESCIGDGVKTSARRPIRNRIKPENKDFVYDLSSLVKKENNDVQNDITRSLRRRNTMNVGAVEPVARCLASLLGPASGWDHIRGAAQRLAASVISSGAAASNTQPELPTARPQMRQRLISTQRADKHSVPVIEASELEAARLQSTLLEDTFLGKVAKASPTSFKIKPLLSLQTSTLNRLLEKVDSSLHQSANGKSSPSETTCSDENVLNSMHISPPPSIPRANTPPPPPRKRVSMLDRLRDDTFRYRDSLLRSALEN